MGVIETITEVAKLAQKADNIELVKTILGLQQQCYELIFENKNLRAELENAKEALKTSETLIYRNNAYWVDGEARHAAGPICAHCWDAKRVFVRMVDLGNGWADCIGCKAHVEVDRRKSAAFGSTIV